MTSFYAIMAGLAKTVTQLSDLPQVNDFITICSNQC